MASRQAPGGPALPAPRAADRHARRRRCPPATRSRSGRRSRSPSSPARTSSGRPDGTSCHDVTVTGCAAAGFAPGFRHRTLDFHTAMALAAAGLGVTLVPRLGQAAVPPGAIVRPLADPAPARHVFAATRAGAERPPGRRRRARRAQPRIRLSTSSRLASMCSRETRLSRHRRSSGSVLDGPHVEVPVLVVDRDAVELADLGVAVARAELLQLRRLVGDLGVDLARDEVARAVRLEQLGQRPAALAEQLEDQQRGQRPGVGVVEVGEVVVAGDLAAERAALLAHARLEERVPDAVHERGAARRRDRVGDRARGAHVVEDVGAGVRLQHRAREQRA